MDFSSWNSNTMSVLLFQIVVIFGLLFVCISYILLYVTEVENFIRLNA
jgi:hypothetical protein